MVSSPSVFVLGGVGASQLPGCEGEGGPVSFGVVFCGEWRRVSFGVVFCGEWRRVSFGVVFCGEWRRVSFGVVFCGEWRRVSFRGCEGGRGASQLWSLFVVCFCFETSRRASQLPGL